jgi:hypothetical protein
MTDFVQRDGIKVVIAVDGRWVAAKIPVGFIIEGDLAAPRCKVGCGREI